MSIRAVTHGLRRLFGRDAAERDLRDEVAQYLDLSIAEYMRSGLSRSEATRRARIDFGGVEAAKDGVRGAGWDGTLDTLYRDVAQGVRGLRRNPGYSVVALITLALGIGANTAMFSVVNAVMLRPLPYRDAGRLALIYTDDTRRGLHKEATAFITIEDWRASNRSFQSLAYFNVGRSILTDGIARERTRSSHASGNLFATLGVAAALGRTFTPDDEAGGAPVAVISHSLWQRRFNGDSSVLGRTLETEGGAKGGGVYRIIGVMRPDFYFPDKLTTFWVPSTNYWRFGTERSERFQGWARRWTVIGRLAPGREFVDARTDLARVGSRLAVANPSALPDFPGFATTVTPMLEHVAGTGLQSALWILLGAVVLVLLVACANVANLSLARGAARQQEFAIRRAIGAGRGRLIRQLLMESMVLAVAGGVLGVLLAVAATQLLSAVTAAQLPRGDEVSVDVPVLLFAAAVSIVAGAVFGILPALRVSASEGPLTLKEGGRAAGGVRLRRTSGLLVIAECALAIVLLAGAGLLLRSLDRLHSVDPGFEPRGVLAVRVEFPPDAPRTAAELARPELASPARARGREQLMHNLRSRVASIPGVTDVGMTDDLFITGQGNESITIPGRETQGVAGGELAGGAATPGFFEALQVPVRRGRSLTRDDASATITALYSPIDKIGSLAERERRAIAEPVVVNESFVTRFFPNEDPIGKRFCFDPTGKTYWFVIVGVVGDMHRQGLDRRAIPEFFGSYFPKPTGRADLIVRLNGDPLAAVSNVRQAVSQTFPGVLITSVTTVDQQLGDFSAQRDLQTWLLSAFAVLALALAAVGIYGVVHYGVAERTREIGVRIALGATPGNVMRLVIGQGMRTPILGIVIGLAGALAAMRLMSHLLFDVKATDPGTFAAVAAVLTVVAAAACYFPARRATRVDAVQALRRD